MKDFDFKKEQRELIRKELRPILYEQGFILSRPTTYVRERNGLLQQFYFRIEASRLRPWITYRPVYDSRETANFGTDRIDVYDYSNPYTGFSWVCLEDWDDAERSKRNFQGQFLPKFENLKQSIIKGVLPEMNKINSLEDFISLYETNGLLFQKKIRFYHNSDHYYKFIDKVKQSSGRERMKLIIKEMGDWELPKAVQEYLESHKDKLNTEMAADKIFDEYCNKVRIANKLSTK